MQLRNPFLPALKLHLHPNLPHSVLEDQIVGLVPCERSDLPAGKSLRHDICAKTRLGQHTANTTLCKVSRLIYGFENRFSTCVPPGFEGMNCGSVPRTQHMQQRLTFLCSHSLQQRFDFRQCHLPPLRPGGSATNALSCFRETNARPPTLKVDKRPLATSRAMAWRETPRIRAASDWEIQSVSDSSVGAKWVDIVNQIP